MPVTTEMPVLAVLTAKANKVEELKAALSALVEPTRQEPGNLEYSLFQLRQTPHVFYVRETWRDQAALEHHVSLPHFQTFLLQMDELLAEPLRLDYLTPVVA